MQWGYSKKKISSIDVINLHLACFLSSVVVFLFLFFFFGWGGGGCQKKIFEEKKSGIPSVSKRSVDLDQGPYCL